MENVYVYGRFYRRKLVTFSNDMMIQKKLNIV